MKTIRSERHCCTNSSGNYAKGLDSSVDSKVCVVTNVLFVTSENAFSTLRGRQILFKSV